MSRTTSAGRAAGASPARLALVVLFVVAPLLVVVVLVARSSRRARLRARAAEARIASAARPAAVRTAVRAGAPAPAPAEAVRASRVSRLAPKGPARFMVTAGAVTVAVVLAVTGAAGSYAFYNTSATVTAGTISSGSLAMTVQSGSTAAGTSTAIPAASFQNMLPGDWIGVPVTVANTGSATATITARLAATPPTGWEVRLGSGACPTTQLTTAPLTATAVPYGRFPGGASTTACLQVTLRSDAAANVAALGFDLVIDATQVPSS